MDQNLSSGIKQEYHLFIVDALIKAKEKEKKAEKAMHRAAILFFAVLIVGIAYALYRINTGIPVSSYLTFLLADGIIICWITALFICFYNFENKSRYFDKKEKDFEELKEDVIDRAGDIWYTTQTEQQRLEKYYELKEKYDINLFHK